MGGTDTEIRVSTEIRPWRRKFSRRSCRDSNPRPFNHESGALTTELSPPPRLPIRGTQPLCCSPLNFYIYIHIDTHIHTHARTHAHTHASTHARIHTHTHTHTQRSKNQIETISFICCTYYLFILFHCTYGLTSCNTEQPIAVYNVNFGGILGGRG